MTLRQVTFGIPEPVEKKEKKKRKRGMIPAPSYWVCKKKHVFMQRRTIFEHQIEKMNCPICYAKVQNKSTKSTYEYFLKKEGRLDRKVSRMAKAKPEKKAGNLNG